jgi:alkylhydroperoxidase family enzyme
MRKGLLDIPETIEDREAMAFRIRKNLGSVCCQSHHLAMITLCLASDVIDAEIMWQGVRSCTSMRWADLAASEWLLDVYGREPDVAASRRRFALFLLDDLLGIEEM